MYGSIFTVLSLNVEVGAGVRQYGLTVTPTRDVSANVGVILRQIVKFRARLTPTTH